MTVPKSFYAIAVLALLWNIIGDAAYLTQVTMDLNTLAQTDPYQAQMFAQMSKWLWSTYAIAVWVGTMASIALLLRRKIAVPFYLVSFIAVLVQFGYTFFATTLLSVKGPTAALFPIIIIVLAAAQFAFARKVKAQGMLH